MSFLLVRMGCVKSHKLKVVRMPPRPLRSIRMLISRAHTSMHPPGGLICWIPARAVLPIPRAPVELLPAAHGLFEVGHRHACPSANMWTSQALGPHLSWRSCVNY